MERYSVFIGCDPGKSGGIVALDAMGNVLLTHAMPVIGKEYDLQKIHDLLDHYSRHKVYVGIENVHAIQGKAGNSSNFSFGLGKGILMGIVSGLKMPYLLVNPRQWQKETWEGVTKQSDTKKTSLIAAKRLFPDQDFLASERSRKPHDGIVDAMLIGEYCRRKFK